MTQAVDKKTADLRKYMDQQFGRSQLALHSMQNDIDSANKNVVMQIRQSQEDMHMMRDQLTQSIQLPEAEATQAQGVGTSLSVPFELDGEEFTLELNNIRAIDVVDLEREDDEDGGQMDYNILDQINQVEQEAAAVGQLSTQDRNFFKSVFEQVTESMERKGPDYVQKKKTESMPNNFESQFPGLVQELEGLADDAGQGLPEDAKQTLADLKRKRYADFLEEGRSEQELAGKERA